MMNIRYYLGIAGEFVGLNGLILAEITLIDLEVIKGWVGVSCGIITMICTTGWAILRLYKGIKSGKMSKEDRQIYEDQVEEIKTQSEYYKSKLEENGFLKSE